MDARLDHAKLLDQLQTEVNRVLEQTGRVFAAATSKDPRANPIGQASKLKQILPDSANRFHDALDELEEELHFARTVIRRDLALCRYASGAPPVTSAQRNTSDSAAPAVSDDPNGQNQPAKADGNTTDTVMEGTNSQLPTEDTKPGDADTAKNPAPVSDPNKDDASKDQQSSGGQDGSKDANINTTHDKASTNKDEVQNQETSAPSKAEAESSAQPTVLDTAVSTATDLDSLFGAPTSAGDAGAAADNEFTHNANNDDDMFDFNFDAGGTADDNDNNETGGGAVEDTSFLAGLQDYAEGGDGDENTMDATDLDALFSDLAAAPNSSNQNKDGEGEKETSFDDFMDFGDFNAGDMGTTGGEGGGGGGDFDFDFS